MKITLTATISTNGKIFINELKSNFKPPQSYLDFILQLATPVKNVVIGRRLFEASPEVWLNLHPEIEIVVISKTIQSTSEFKVAETPEMAIAYLKGKSRKEVVVVGGVKTYQSFLDTGKVSDLHLEIAPYLIVGGGELNSEKHPFMQFKKLSSDSTKNGGVRLHLVK